jgi:hypothetical protein
MYGSAILKPGESIVLKLPASSASYNRVWLGEQAATDGQMVTSYKLEAPESSGTGWQTLTSAFNAMQSGWLVPAGTAGSTIGLRHLGPFNETGTDATGAMRFTLLAATGGKSVNITVMAFHV